MTKEVAEMIQQYAELVCDHDISDSITMELLKAVEFRRIADALESISSILESIDQTLEGATEMIVLNPLYLQQRDGDKNGIRA